MTTVKENIIIIGDILDGNGKKIFSEEQIAEKYTIISTTSNSWLDIDGMVLTVPGDNQQYIINFHSEARTTSNDKEINLQITIDDVEQSDSKVSYKVAHNKTDMYESVTLTFLTGVLTSSSIIKIQWKKGNDENYSIEFKNRTLSIRTLV